jgi:predicted ArsR family transcriptional regulator
MATRNVIENRENDFDLLYVLMQPTRQKIIKLLKESKEPLYIAQIAEKIGETPRNVSFHLQTLAEYGFVDGEYHEIQPPTHNSPLVLGKAAKFYRLTPKVDEVVKRLAKGV